MLSGIADGIGAVLLLRAVNFKWIRLMNVGPILLSLAA